MSFSAGFPVAVVGLRRHGRVLEVLSGGRYRVVVGGMTMVCHEAQLETISRSKKEQRRERQASTRVREAATLPPASPSQDGRSSQSIDLHGMTVSEALAALPAFLDRAIRDGRAQVEIIHGIGGGRLRVAVRDYLAKTPAVTMAVRDEKNPGVTIAYF
jgi:dsDNA-specific endonuclease/ATPase MutS2